MTPILSHHDRRDSLSNIVDGRSQVSVGKPSFGVTVQVNESRRDVVASGVDCHACIKIYEVADSNNPAFANSHICLESTSPCPVENHGPADQDIGVLLRGLGFLQRESWKTETCNQNYKNSSKSHARSRGLDGPAFCRLAHDDH